MKHLLLMENQKKRLELPLWMMLCFAMFCVWQMGFIYFIGPSLTLNGRTPLPIDMDNVTMLIAVSYVLSIAFMIALPHLVVWAERISASAALLTVLGLFLPLSEELLRLLIYLQTFFCCFMIGFETFVIVNYFSERSAIRHLTVAYGAACALVATIQNDFIPGTYPVFRLLTVVMLVAMLVFFFRLPAGRDACPTYVKKGDGLTPPHKLFAGAIVLVFAGSLMAVSGPAMAEEVKHGVFITYCVDAAAGFLIWLLYKMAGIHPFRSISLCIACGCVGALLMHAAAYVPWLAYVACGLIGIGMVPCQMLPLYNLMMMKTYPSRFLVPITIGLALAAVLVQSTMVELFRDMPSMLYLAYAVIMVILAVVYLQMAPYLVYAFWRKPEDAPQEDSPAEAAAPQAEHTVHLVETAVHLAEAVSNTLHHHQEEAAEEHLAQLTAREREVLNLIGYGYSNRDIAQLLVISEHTVNDYTKKIYRKLDVHSRHAAAQIINRYGLKQHTAEKR